MPRKKKIDAGILSSREQIESYLEQNKTDHYNFEKDYNYVVSSGSLILDLEMGGGINAGIVRFSGVSGGGKTSCALAFAKNFQNSIEDSKVIYIRSEGRLPKEMLDRSGVDQDDEKWFCYDSNIFESAIGLIRNLVFQNEEDKRYMFIIDSMDALIRKEDNERQFGEPNKVAGGPLLTSQFLQKMALSFMKKGHICIMVSQVRSTITINPYQKVDPKLTNASGGNAALHYSDWILEFQKTYKADIFTKKVKGKDVDYGHKCKIFFRKTPNERVGKLVEYPIIHGRMDGKSVWVEREVMDMMLMWEMTSSKGAWITVSDEVIKELKDNNIEFDKQHQGPDKFCKYLEEKPEAVKFIFNKFKDILNNEAL
jgi:RecA/RadA recombinase